MWIIKKIRMFGLEYCDLPTMVWNVGVMLRVFTLNVDPRHTKRTPIFIYITTFISVCSYYYAYFFSTIWFVFVRSRENKDLVAGMVAFSISLCSEIGPTKLVFLAMNRKEIKTLVGECLELNSHVIPGSRFHENLLKKMRIVKKRCIFFGIMMTINGGVYIFRHLLSPGRRPLEENYPYYGLEPPLETPYYEISYILGTISTVYMIHLTTHVTGLLLTLSGYIESQMLALAEEFQELWIDADKHYRELVSTNDCLIAKNQNTIKNEYIKKQLQYIINIHTANIQILHQTEHAFRGALAAEFVLLILSLIAELLGGLENTYIQIPYGFALVGMDCLAGQRVLDAGMAFEKAVYDSKWENFNAENMKIVWMILINSQKPLNLSAGGLAMLNLRILMTVLRSIYSAYTALSSHLNHICQSNYNIFSTMFQRAWQYLRRFGMDYCDLPTTIWNLSFLLRIITINVDSRNKSRINFFCYLLTAVSGLSYFYVFFFSLIQSVIWHCRQTGNYEAAVCVLSLLIATEIGTFKLLYTLFQCDAIRETIDSYIALDAEIALGSRLSKNILGTMKQVKWRAFLYWLSIIGNGVFYVVMPLAKSGRRFMDDLFTVYGLEPMNESPNYEIGYLLVSFSCFFICYPSATVTGLVIIISGYTEAQMRGLSEELLYIWNDAEKYYEEQKISKDTPASFNDCDEIIIKNTYIRNRLNVIVDIHVKNLKLYGGIEKIFRFSIIVEFVLLGIAMVSHLLGGLENTYTALPFPFIQVMMDCVVGQRLIDASIMLEEAVYDSKWEHFDVTNRKTILMILQNSQRSITLSAGGIVPLNFQFLMTIIRMIYSAYTTLRSTMNF
ncbi:uncharacterized protein LOC113513506 [Galleria mellonella]|uniref:Uncharacterized protein LOC113513506 n=1 Tax=Galleria mellonella TaxID=7137 RepID=A0ABM3MI45_GALME|nr:uncharacterized protein LOC113513506 [Galleria mellonella]